MFINFEGMEYIGAICVVVIAIAIYFIAWER